MGKISDIGHENLWIADSNSLESVNAFKLGAYHAVAARHNEQAWLVHSTFRTFCLTWPKFSAAKCQRNMDNFMATCGKPVMKAMNASKFFSDNPAVVNNILAGEAAAVQFKSHRWNTNVSIITG